MDRLLLLLLLLLSLAARAGEAPVVSVKPAGPGLAASTSLILPVKPCEAYAMLTDYDALPTFIPGLLHSHAQRQSGDKVRVMQEGVVQVFLFHVHMKSLLEMEETPDRRIVFRQISGDFKSYTGSWGFSANAQGTLLEYQATLSFRPYVPLFLAKSVLLLDMKRKFSAIAQEAVARKEKGMLRCRMGKH